MEGPRKGQGKAVEGQWKGCEKPQWKLLAVLSRVTDFILASSACVSTRVNRATSSISPCTHHPDTPNSAQCAPLKRPC